MIYDKTTVTVILLKNIQKYGSTAGNQQTVSYILEPLASVRNFEIPIAYVKY